MIPVKEVRIHEGEAWAAMVLAGQNPDDTRITAERDLKMWLAPGPCLVAQRGDVQSVHPLGVFASVVLLETMPLERIEAELTGYNRQGLGDLVAGVALLAEERDRGDADMTE